MDEKNQINMRHSVWIYVHVVIDSKFISAQ